MARYVSSPLDINEIQKEINRLRKLLLRYNQGELMPDDFSYRDTVWALEHYRNKHRNLSKKRGKKDVG